PSLGEDVAPFPLLLDEVIQPAIDHMLVLVPKVVVTSPQKGQQGHSGRRAVGLHCGEFICRDRQVAKLGKSPVAIGTLQWREELEPQFNRSLGPGSYVRDVRRWAQVEPFAPRRKGGRGSALAAWPGAGPSLTSIGVATGRKSQRVGLPPCDPLRNP